MVIDYLPAEGIIISNHLSISFGKQGEMFDILCTSDGATIWGVLLLAIIVVGALVHVLKKDKGPGIAMCQIVILDGDRSGNFVRIENAIAEAKSKGAELICFLRRRCSAGSIPMRIPGPAQSPGRIRSNFANSRKIRGIPLYRLEEFELGRLFNSALLIDDREQILLKYRQGKRPAKIDVPSLYGGK